jgi:signal transduction histidine kinase
MTSGRDSALLRRAAWSVAAQTALAVALVVVVVASGVVLLFDRQQASETRDLVRRAATTADDVNDPPEEVWLVRLQGVSRKASQGTPQAVLTSAQLGRAAPGPLAIDTADGPLRAWVADRDGARYVAVYDPSRHRAEEHRLAVSTLVAGLVGVLLAGATGLVVGRRAVRPLGEAMELQRRFVADASHELRTPLAVLHTRAQMVRRHLPQEASPRLRGEVDQLVGDTGSLGEVVSDLLLAAQLEHADMPSSDVDLTHVARDVVASMRPYAEESGVRLEVAETTERAGDLVVTGAPTALRRALTALVDNAIAHSERGMVVRVEVQDDAGSAVATGEPSRHGSVRMSVHDEGEGLDPADASMLRQRFARGASSSTSSGRRFGLGLALVDEVVRAHHGRLEITGARGEGSSFTMVIPRQGTTGRR